MARLVAISVCLVAVSGCAQKSQAVRTPQYTKFSRIEGIKQHPLCKFGMPEHSRSWVGGPTQVVSRQGYVLDESLSDKIPVWVCEHVVTDHLVKKAERGDNFAPDPELPKNHRAELVDYRGSGFDRGHNAPAGDFDYSQPRKDESFFLSNMCPQVGRGFNQSIWRVLEDRTRDVVRNRGEAFIITGNLFWEPEEEGPAADGKVEFQVIGPHDVAVPTHCYKIIIAPEQPGSVRWQTIAFVLENANHPSEPDNRRDFAAFVKPIDWIETRLGVNFMPELDQGNPDLEEQLERNAPPVWAEYRAK